jgi:hypothetical protein
VRNPGSEQRVRVNKWRQFEHIRWDGQKEIRYIREIIYGKKRELRYWEITRDKEDNCSDSSWYVMTKIPNIKYKEVGGIYGVRTWIEYGFKNSKNELGWADFRVTNYDYIAKWWQLVMSAYLMICLHDNIFNPLAASPPEKFKEHINWSDKKSWNTLLNNLRLVLQPFISFNLIYRWLKVFPIPQLTLGFPRLINLINEYDCLRYLVYFWDELYPSSA